MEPVARANRKRLKSSVSYFQEKCFFSILLYECRCIHTEAGTFLDQPCTNLGDYPGKNQLITLITEIANFGVTMIHIKNCNNHTKKLLQSRYVNITLNIKLYITKCGPVLSRDSRPSGDLQLAYSHRPQYLSNHSVLLHLV